MTDMDCAARPNTPHCDTTPNMAGLPRDACVACLDTSQCPTGQVCIGNACQPTCTTDAQCSADGGGMTPHCNSTTSVCAECGADSHCSGMTPYCIPAGTCEQCLTDAQCATVMNRPLCNPANYTCVQCITNAECTPPATCGRGGTCTGGGMDGGGPPGRDGGGGPG
jgi:hypothetical protein